MTSETQISAEAVVRFIAIGYRVLAARALTLLSMLMAFGLFAWAMATQTGLSLGTAVAFAFLVFLPSLIRDARQNNGE